jgi:phosphoribosyl-ATP pyrophosphohydrolase
MNSNDVFLKLFEIIENRKSSEPEKSYVASLMHKGTQKINEKILEEAKEVCEAAFENDKSHLVYEICDLMFHTFVLAGHNNITLNEIAAELERRFDMSGLEEKARRNKEK